MPKRTFLSTDVNFETVSPPLCPNSLEIVLKIGTLVGAGGEVIVSVESNPPISDEMDWNSYFKALRTRLKAPHPMGTFCITVRADEIQFDPIECNMPEGGADPFMQAIEPSMRGLHTELVVSLIRFPSLENFKRIAEQVADVWCMHRAAESCGGRITYADPELPHAPLPVIPVKPVSVERILSLGRPGQPPSTSMQDVFSTGQLLVDMEGSGKDRAVLVAYRRPGKQIQSGWFSPFLAECAAERLSAHIKKRRPTVADEVMLAFPDGGVGQAADILERLFNKEEGRGKP